MYILKLAKKGVEISSIEYLTVADANKSKDQLINIFDLVNNGGYISNFKGDNEIELTTNYS